MLKTLDSIDEETLELLLTAISKTSRRPNDNNNNTRCAACENEHVTIPRREGTATIGDNRVRKIQPAFPLSLSLSLRKVKSYGPMNCASRVAATP